MLNTHADDVCEPTSTIEVGDPQRACRSVRIHRWLAAIGLMVGIVVLSRFADAQQETKGSFSRLDSKNLPNAMWVHPRVMSGGMPTGKPAFEELARLGIKTVISVDGIKPDVEGAHAAGLRYIHLPHGYDGISAERLMQLSKAVKDLPGPVYIHCHHGRHRSPVASAAVCISLGQLSPAEGKEILREAGTNPAFRGLIRVVENATTIPLQQLDDMQVDFVSASEVPPIVESMVAMDSIFDRLLDHKQQGWNDSVPDAVADALMLKEHYMELWRCESEKKRESYFLDLLDQGRGFAEQLEGYLQGSTTLNSAVRSVQADGVMKQLSNNCSQCHRQYRDNR